jgi:MerC mercury resistance protein
VRLRSIADTFGATGSLICAFHCLAGPIILLTGAVAPTVLLPNEAFHYAMLGLVVPAGVIAFAIGCREHRDRLTLCLGAAGLMSFVLVATVLHGLVGEVGERVLTVLSACTLVVAHVRNFWLCRAARCRHAHCGTQGVPADRPRPTGSARG